MSHTMEAWQAGQEFWSYSNDPWVNGLRRDIYWRTVRHMYGARRVRQHYASLERGRYGRSWDLSALLEGGNGDAGDLCKLETGRRGLREYSKSKIAHEWFDLWWTGVVVADKAFGDSYETEKCFAELLYQRRFEDEYFDEITEHESKPFHAINFYTESLNDIHRLTKPLNKSYVFSPEEKSERLREYCSNAFKAVVFLADFYEIDTDETIIDNNWMLAVNVMKATRTGTFD